MKKSLSWAVPAAVLSLCVYYSIGVAQGPAGPVGAPPMAGPPMAGQPMTAQSAPAPTRTALLDVSFIFKNHHRFRALMEEMRGQVQAAEAQVQAEKKQITKMAETLQSYNKGSPEYKELDERINEQSTRLQITVNKQKAEFLKQEAHIYFNVYQEICQATDYFCRQYNFDLVIKFTRDDASPENPESVLNMINKPVVWQRGLDITQNILDDLNRGAPANPAAADRGAAPRPPANPYGNLQR